ncbi:hypothetical protein OHU34_06250 [Streptomyces sp. NBC_00080]|nr:MULTISPECIES: hypothetical protein [Streptomyces]TQJ57252.1 hypothetical protein FBY34_5098 [Streptomyces sp. SLBN-115]
MDALACFALAEVPGRGGRFAEIVPHLTIARGQEDAVLAGIEADLVGNA